MDEFEDILYNEYDSRQLVRFPASHHGSPLTYYPQRHVVQLLGKISKIQPTKVLSDWCEAIKSLNSSFGHGYACIDDPTLVYSYLFNQSTTTGSSDNTTEEVIRSVGGCLRISITEVQTDLKYLVQQHPGLQSLKYCINVGQEDINEISISLSRVMVLRSALEKIRNTIQLNHVNRNESLTTVGSIGPFTVYVMREMSIFQIKNPDKLFILLNYDQILMLFDTISCRALTRITLELSAKMNVDNLPPWELMKQIYRWGDNLITNYGMPAYSIIGEFESIITGIFVTYKDTDTLGLGEEYMKSVADTASEVETECSIPSQATADLIELLRSINSQNWLSEIFGLRKHWGNPMVDARASGLAVQEKIAEVLPVKGTSLIKLLASFNRMIITNFIAQHGKWPEGYFTDEGQNTPIGVAFESRSTRIPETHIDHKHEHWANFHFLPNCLLDSYFNDLSLISDKSVSLYRSNLDATYVHKLCKHPPPIDVPENRRLILEYIRTNHLSILDIFKIVMTDSIPDEWLANCASMKGTEMKYNKARIFAVLTYELRQYFVATEDMIKTHLFRYNPHQTMTMSEKDLLAKLRSITKQLDPESDSRYLSVMHIVDFSKWNLRMRYSNTCLIFKAMDDFLGTPGLIEQSHKIFSNMLNMVQDSFNPPDSGVNLTESETIWRGHHCGWEGQRQKGWTILTSALLSDLARITGVNSTICGQGDNQTLLAQFPIPDRFKNPHDWIRSEPHVVKKVIDDYYHKLEKECLEVGLKIKTAETCRSLSFFNYGKRLYVGGIELSMTLKRISKNITEPNESYPTSESLLKTLEGSAFAAGLYSHPSLLPYIISRFVTALQLESCFLKNQLLGEGTNNILHGDGFVRDKMHSFLSILMKIPPSLGGPPQLSLASYLFRGHPDPLCTDLVNLTMRAAGGCKRSLQIISCALNQKWFRKDKSDMRALICSPYSLNLNIPLSCRTPLEAEIKPALENRCRNSLVRGMFMSSMDRLDNEIITALSKMEPFHPLVANDIYSRSLPGKRQSFISGLANTTSLGRLIFENAYNPLILKVAELEHLQLTFWRDRVIDIVRQENLINEVPPHHLLADEFRKKSWGTELVGITVPHPLEQFTLLNSDHDVCTEKCLFHMPEHLVLVQHSEDLSALKGRDFNHITTIRSRAGSPYLGSTVAEGVIQKQIQCVNPDETWRDIIRLNTVRKWVTNRDSEFDKLLLSLLRTRTDVDQQTIDLATGVPSRLSFNHRASLVATISSCGISTTSNMHSRLYLSSDRMGHYSHGDCNYHMAFGPTFLCYQELLCLKGVYSPETWSSKNREVYHVHVRREDVPIVYDSAVNLSTDKVKITNPKNIPRLLFSSEEKLVFEFHSGSSFFDLWDTSSGMPAIDARYGYSYQLIADIFVKETAIKETITQIHFSGYEPRPLSVTIGDIGLVGVKTLVRALAWNFLLMGPAGLWKLKDESSFKVRAHSFVSCFSNRFWETFTPSLSSERNRQQLFRFYEGVSDPLITRQHAGLRSILMVGVVMEMWNLYSHLHIVITQPNSKPPVNIYAPSAVALRLLLSRYIEMVVFMGMWFFGQNPFDAYKFSRDFSTNLLSVEAETIRPAFLIIQDDFKELSKKYMNGYVELPVPSLLPLQYQWIDVLHSIARPAPLVTRWECILPPNDHPKLQDLVTFMVPELSVDIMMEQCDCPNLERFSRLHSECYFLTSGILSKSHTKFMDIVWALQLDMTGVMCLGSSTGTDALSFASMSSCEHVYVNCLHNLNGFSPHMAGSYVPAAFVNGKYKSKLVSPSSAAVASSDLLLRDTIKAIIAHTEDLKFTGITCDAEFPNEEPKLVVPRLLKRILKIVKKTSTIEWLICKSSFSCAHDIKRFAAMLATAFETVHVVLSPFSRPGSLLIYLTGVNRRSLCKKWNEGIIPSIIVGDTQINELVNKAHRSEICQLFYFNNSVRSRLLRVSQIGDHSLKYACSKYIPGWCPRDIPEEPRDFLRSSINYIRQALISQANDYLNTYAHSHSIESQSKNTILAIDLGPLHSKLNLIYTAVSRCDLLSDLLRDEVVNIPDVVIRIMKWISTEHEYPMLNRNFRVEMNENNFINVTSRYLWEILGHAYGDNYNCESVAESSSLFHHLEPADFGSSCSIMEQIKIGRYPSQWNLRWKWGKRSLLVTLMLVVHLSDKFVIINSSIEESIKPLVRTKGLSSITTDPNCPDGVAFKLIKSLSDLECLKQKEAGEYYLSLPVNLFPLLNQEFNVISIYKCPWSGIIPNTVLVHCRTTSQINNEVCYPLMDSLVNRRVESFITFTGCQCWDCCMETFLCEKYYITHSELDKLCSMREIESVRDSTHKL